MQVGGGQATHVITLYLTCTRVFLSKWLSHLWLNSSNYSFTLFFVKLCLCVSRLAKLQVFISEGNFMYAKQLRIKKRDRFSFINCAYHLLQLCGVLKCDVTLSDRSSNFSILHPSSVRPSSLAICLSWRLYQRRHKVSHGQEDVLRLLCAYCKYYIMCLRVKKTLRFPALSKHQATLVLFLVSSLAREVSVLLFLWVCWVFFWFFFIPPHEFGHAG